MVFGAREQLMVARLKRNCVASFNAVHSSVFHQLHLIIIGNFRLGHIFCSGCALRLALQHDAEKKAKCPRIEFFFLLITTVSMTTFSSVCRTNEH